MRMIKCAAAPGALLLLLGAIAVVPLLLSPAVATAASPSGEFLERWRTAERLYQVLDVQGYHREMSALALQAADLDLRERSFFYFSAARAACLAGDPAYSNLAGTGLVPLTDEVIGTGELRALRNGLQGYSRGSTALAYGFFNGRPTDPPAIGLREAQFWLGSLVSYFATRRYAGSSVGPTGATPRVTKSIPGLDLQSLDSKDFQRHGRGEDYMALQLTYCAGVRNQAHVVLPDLPLRLAPHSKVAAQAFGLNPRTRVRVTWRHRARGGQIYGGPFSCTARSRRLGKAGVVRKVLAVTGTDFAFRAPRQRGCWSLRVAPIGQSAGLTRRRYSGEVQAMVTVKPGRAVLRRDFTSLRD